MRYALCFMRQKGRLIIFTGDGRGKTSAAFGLALRMLGAGNKVFIAQLLKRRPSGEAIALARNRLLKLENYGTGRFVKDGKPSALEGREARRALADLAKAVESKKYALVVADEIFAACSLGLVTLRQVKELAASRANGTHLVFTGRGASPSVVAIADDVSEMKKLKHSYDKGGKAERGLEL
jgi:cob(I)alamin adenosyltransferase